MPIQILLSHAMREKDLLDKFRDYLFDNYPNKKERLNLLSDILRMDKEPVARRLSGKVQFTVKEIGIIAKRLDISVDNLINNKSHTFALPLDMLMPFSVESMDTLVDYIGYAKEKLKKISDGHIHMGCIFNFLPVEFYISNKNLSKFMYFKWAYYFTKGNLNMNYVQWQPPSQINTFHEELLGCWNNFESVFYIWDYLVIWNLVKEIQLFFKMHIINQQDISLIEKDLHTMLNNIEEYINQEKKGKVFDLYISRINIGVSLAYFTSGENSLIDYKTPFIESKLCEDNEAFNKTYEWMNSIKKISTLISGSGAMDRRIFFDEQHRIIDNIL